MSCTHAKTPRLNVTTLLLTDIARLSVRRKGQTPQKQRWGTKRPGTGRVRAPNAEVAQAVIDYFGAGKRMLYLSVLNNLSVDCDCVSTPAPIEMRDIGIAAALDPVALDQACVDLVNQAPDGASLVERIESRRGPHILDHAQQLGLGHKNYQLVSLDR